MPKPAGSIKRSNPSFVPDNDIIKGGQSHEKLCKIGLATNFAVLSIPYTNRGSQKHKQKGKKKN